jgi:hypothetical protein
MGKCLELVSVVSCWCCGGVCEDSSLWRKALYGAIERQFLTSKRVGAEEACWAHNPKVGGSKPPPARLITFPFRLFCFISIHFFCFQSPKLSNQLSCLAIRSFSKV